MPKKMLVTVDGRASHMIVEKASCYHSYIDTTRPGDEVRSSALTGMAVFILQTDKFGGAFRYHKWTKDENGDVALEVWDRIA